MIIFDIGANDGSFGLQYADDLNNTIYAFEPTPHLLHTILWKINKPNYIVVPKIVSNFTGKIPFNVAGNADWGCSSVFEFSSDLYKTWPGRDDFKVTNKIEVDSVTMKDFIEQNNIEKIDIFHCDAQGNDLNVLLSFKEHINKIVRGEVEAFEKNPLYKEANNSRQNVINFLIKNNFKILDIESNDNFHNEVNIVFERK
jgi:FkbM family methyltransferase